MRRDPLTDRVRALIDRLRHEHGEMEQIELARRAKEPQQRVHRFLAGQMPYPPMSFLDKLLRVFGYTLEQALSGHGPPPIDGTVLRPDVMAVARLLERRSEGYVEALRVMLEEGRRGQSTAPRATRPSGTRGNDSAPPKRPQTQSETV